MGVNRRLLRAFCASGKKLNTFHTVYSKYDNYSLPFFALFFFFFFFALLSFWTYHNFRSLKHSFRENMFSNVLILSALVSFQFIVGVLTLCYVWAIITFARCTKVKMSHLTRKLVKFIYPSRRFCRPRFQKVANLALCGSLSKHLKIIFRKRLNLT